MEKYYLINPMPTSGDRYVYKGYPRHTRSGGAMCTITKNIKDARRFKTREAAIAVIKQFTPSMFNGGEMIVEIINKSTNKQLNKSTVNKTFYELRVTSKKSGVTVWRKLYSSLRTAGREATRMGFYADDNLWVRITPIELEK